MPDNEFDEIFSEEMNTKINEIEVEIKLEREWNGERLWEVYQEVENCFLLVEKRIFRDKGFRFMKGEDIECEGMREFQDWFERRFERDDDDDEVDVPFGVLVVWEDTFIPRVTSFW